MNLVFHYHDNESDYSGSDISNVSYYAYKDNPAAVIPSGDTIKVQGKDFLGWWQPLSLGLTGMTKALSCYIGEISEESDTEVDLTPKTISKYGDLWWENSDTGNEVACFEWTGKLLGNTHDLTARLFMEGVTEYVAINIDNTIKKQAALENGEYVFEVTLGTTRYLLTFIPTYYDPEAPGESDINLYAMYSGGGSGGTNKYKVTCAWTDVDGTTKTSFTNEYEEDTTWEAIKTEVDTIAMPTRAYGFWKFNGWTGIPQGTSTKITANTTLWGAFEAIDFLLPCRWSGTPIVCHWGAMLPDISSLPAVAGKTLNSFWLAYTEDLSKALIKSHDASGSALISAEYSMFGGETIDARSVSATDEEDPPEADCTVVALYREPILWDTQEGLHKTVGIVPTPFATDPSATMSLLPDDASDASDASDDISFQKGFPNSFTRPIISKANDNYGQVDKSARVITRQMMNTLGNLGTQERFFSQCGGYYSFDEEVCNAIGGYPESAVLRYYDDATNTLRTVYSLQDNNYWNFLTDNPSLSIYVDYGNYVDLADTLFVDTGLADLYEVPYDAWLDVFSFSFCDMQTTKHISTEDVPAIYKVEGGSLTKKGTLYYDKLNGGHFTNFSGHTYLDIYNAKTNTTNSVLLRDEGSMVYGASLWNDNLNRGMRYFYKQPRYVTGQGTFFLKKGDQIRIRGEYVDHLSDAFKTTSSSAKIWDSRTVHDMALTDKEVRRTYLYKHAMLYRVGWRA